MVIARCPVRSEIECSTEGAICSNPKRLRHALDGNNDLSSRVYFFPVAVGDWIGFRAVFVKENATLTQNNRPGYFKSVFWKIAGLVRSESGELKLVIPPNLRVLT